VFSVEEVFSDTLRASAAFRTAVVEQLPVVRAMTAR
jgi:hypothetical protein